MVFNNPIRFNDPLGLHENFWEWFIQEVYNKLPDSGSWNFSEDTVDKFIHAYDSGASLEWAQDGGGGFWVDYNDADVSLVGDDVYSTYYSSKKPIFVNLANKIPGQKRIDYALSLPRDKWTYGQKRGKAGELDFSDSYCDCSEFVLLVLKETDPKVYQKLIMTDAQGRQLGNTGTIQNGISALGGSIRTSDPKIGDLAIWTGHVEFVQSVNGSYFTLFGAGGSSFVPRSIGQGWLKIGHSNLNRSWNGNFLGFWTPLGN